MTFYAVTKGSYSDYHIITITTDKEKAEFLAKKFSGRYGDWDAAKVKEYVEIENEILHKPLWDIHFDASGSVTSVIDVSDDEYYIDDINKVFYVTPYTHSTNPTGTRVVVAADDRESAIKIAAEKRAEFLAREEGIA